MTNHPTEQLPRCNEDTHYWSSHAPGNGPTPGTPCKCGFKLWPASAPPADTPTETPEQERAAWEAYWKWFDAHYKSDRPNVPNQCEKL